MDAKEMLEVSKSGIATYVNSYIVPEMIKRAQKGHMNYFPGGALDRSVIGYLRSIGYKVVADSVTTTCISWNND